MKYILPTFAAVFFLFYGCSKDADIASDDGATTVVTPIDDDDADVVLQDTICVEAAFRQEGKIYENSDRTYLWAGDNVEWHFDITDWELNECNLLYGLGRETFPALLEPEYAPLSEIRLELDDIDKCLVLFSGNEVKVYPYEIMISYEVVNEYHNGNPIMIAYCVLADLGAVYSRDYCGHTLTFAVSGYTHFDSNIWGGLDAFILWDRETESLWWPLVDRAISGDLKGFPLNKYNDALWEIMTWKEVSDNYPEAKVLLHGQRQDAPESWAVPNAALFDCN
ncbi:MAG: DUF3179 domain-containing (seleno)protein [Bacteroidota bacterium]